MSLPAGCLEEDTQQVGEIQLTIFDYKGAVSDKNGVLVDPIQSVIFSTHAGGPITVSPASPAFTTTTASCLVDTTACTVGQQWIVLCVATLLSGGKRNAAVAIDVTAKAVV